MARYELLLLRALRFDIYITTPHKVSCTVNSPFRGALLAKHGASTRCILWLATIIVILLPKVSPALSAGNVSLGGPGGLDQEPPSCHLTLSPTRLLPYPPPSLPLPPQTGHCSTLPGSPQLQTKYTWYVFI